MGQGEIAAIGGLVFTVLTWLLGLSFAAGAGFERLRLIERELARARENLHGLRAILQDLEVRLAKAKINGH